MVKQHGVGKAISLVRGWTGCTSFRPDRNTYSRAGEGHRSQAASERRELVDLKTRRNKQSGAKLPVVRKKCLRQWAAARQRRRREKVGEAAFGVMKVLG